MTLGSAWSFRWGGTSRCATTLRARQILSQRNLFLVTVHFCGRARFSCYSIYFWYNNRDLAQNFLQLSSLM
ncbi:hypothetical protein M427DRAFT_51771 [Gonapodya prolifera JEL478]|uniref:Uncharacterized protein n=1 Tax=Gonapodya prolifera (strain JEL478) TaxID=1344416 RepID=A0A139AVT9_GONPJ|nr:hypothetical protein M427DRAFT_51771 [Gonapodya prolifera JEL478]|eukprot:KXS20814.1 hypothetical protein M427DRAFT_51771 [Gonapodya prolifera JEL478]